MNRRLVTITLVAVAAFGLAGCSAGSGANDADGSAGTDAGTGSGTDAGSNSGDSSQTTAEACAAIGAEVDKATEGIQDESAEDPAVAIEAIRAAAEGIGEAAGTVSNNEVAVLLPQLEDAFTAFADTMQAVAIDGDVTKLAEMESVTAEFEDVFATFQELCAG